MSGSSAGGFVPADDPEGIQAAVIAAAIKGDCQVRARLPEIASVFDEPYRTVVDVVCEKIIGGGFIDKPTLGAALAGIRLTRRSVGGAVQQLDPEDVVGLLFASGEELQPAQAEAYVSALLQRQRERRATEFGEQVKSLAHEYAGDPTRLLREIETLVATTRRHDVSAYQEFPSELLELIPYMREQEHLQQGNEFLGLDSGFAHLNNICNGLYPGLLVLAAPPGRGKTTFVWQVACQTAMQNRVPVIFVSMEQSKQELRAKALARLSKLQYRHILRGRLKAGDAQDMARFHEAARRYADFARLLTIIEGDRTTDLNFLERLAQNKMAQMGANQCLICVDYLQILPGAEIGGGRVSAKDVVDSHISDLRRLARKLRSPVFAISSENRAGYKHKSIDVFKESGGIEYGADVAMVLYRPTQQDGGANVEYITLGLNIVKNRNGECGVVKFKFYAKRSEFVEGAVEALEEEPDA